MKVIIVRARAIDPAVNKIAKTLSQNGYEVKLLVWDRQNTLKVKNDEGYAVCRFNFKAPHDRYIVLLYLPIWWAYEFFFLLKENCDVIHTCDLDTLLPAILVKLIKRVKLCYIIYDFYANNISKKVPNIIRKLVASLEKFGIGFTDILFLVDESRYEEVRGAHINKLAYIYNSPPDYFEVKQKQELETQTEMIIFYGGLLVKQRGLEYMMKAIEGLEGVRLVIAGTGTDKKLVEKSACLYKNIRYLGWLPSYEDIVRKTLDADIIFRFSDPKIPKTKYESPNKLFEAMVCGKPIIVSDDSSMANIVSKENCGIVVQYGDVNAIKKAIIKLKNDPYLRQTLGANGRRAYEEKYNWKIMERTLLDAYKNISDREVANRSAR